jgi:DNA helicase-2/ATP-dependent DNA helicase PcrA
VVIIGSLDKRERDPDIKETLIRKFLKKTGEPLDRISKFDNMRMFYVGLSRAKNLLVLPRISTKKNEEIQNQVRFMQPKNLKLSFLKMN